jgi:outer membrane protein assembly factor BamD (BamD/ComL family)
MLTTHLFAQPMDSFPDDFDDDPRTTAQSRHRKSFFLRPARSTPALQLMYAHSLRNRGKIKKAMKHYYALVIKWPYSKEASQAQYEYATLLEQRKKYFKAFEEYEWLISEYPGKFNYNDVLEKQLNILINLSFNKRKTKYRNASRLERLIPLFESLFKNAPQWERTDEAKYFFGQLHQHMKEYNEAIRIYSDIIISYPNSAYREKAAYNKCVCLLKKSEREPENDELLELTAANIKFFMDTYPHSEHLRMARIQSKKIEDLRALTAYRKARFYDHLPKQDHAALKMYRLFLKQFPSSEWTTSAKKRIKQLEKRLSYK